MNNQKLKPTKSKPSDLLENKLKKKEEELKFIQEIFEENGGKQTKEIKNSLNKHNLSIKPVARTKSNSAFKHRDFLEKIEKDKQVREEKEKLRMLEKLENQVLLGKQKRNKLSGLNTATLSKRPIKEMQSQSRLIDNFKTNKGNNKENNTEAKNSTDQLRRTFNKERIVIDCESLQETEQATEKEFWDNLSQDKQKFFMFKMREVYQFLKSIKLLRYIEIFLEDGIEDTEFLLEIDEDYFKERPYPEVHKKKILEKVHEVRQKYKKTSQEETTEAEEVNSREIKKSPCYDKIHKTTAEQGLQEENSFLRANKEKKCCWNCLKVILGENCIEEKFEEKIIQLKSFCSESCRNGYKDKIYSKCGYIECQTKLEKASSRLFDDQWFCDEKCLKEFILGNSEKYFPPENDEIENESSENLSEEEYDPMEDF